MASFGAQQSFLRRMDAAGSRIHRPMVAGTGLQDPVANNPRNSYRDRKSTRLNFSHDQISYAVFCLKKKKKNAKILKNKLTTDTERSKRHKIQPISVITLLINDTRGMCSDDMYDLGYHDIVRKYEQM